MTDRPDPTDPSTEAVFNSISEQAQETNRIRVDSLDRLVRTAATGIPSGGDRKLAKDLAHQIAGSAGTFGFVRASELARLIEALLAGEEDEAVVPTGRLRELLTELRTSLD